MRSRELKSRRPLTSPRRVTLLVVAIGLWAVFIGLILNHEYAITLLPGNPPTSAPDGIVYQSTDYSCGPACLATIFRYYNIIKSEREWAELSGTLITYGTTLPGLVRAGVSIGFEPVELHPTYEQLDLVNYPGIIFKSSAYHLVTFWGMDSDSRVSSAIPQSDARHGVLLSFQITR